ncbi:MAG: hypothetical protein EU531_04165 [Promethearchaeota archaeon]|nr:MAG: hypothetical protein EU531_04165 [Candidatus Lokiarchaeota archaeon]
MVLERKLLIDLNDTDNLDVNLIGMKAANLGTLIQNNIKVPNGYVISTNAYELFLKYNNLEEVIHNELSKMDNKSFESIKLCSTKIRNAFLEGKLPRPLIFELQSKSNSIFNQPLAIRSSALAEDLPGLSFAGQYDSYLNIKGEEDIIRHIKRCYSSLWTTRAISYRIKNNIPHFNLKVALIIQELVSAKSAGILFTTNPINPEQPQIIIESNFGLGESIASGKISPDQFVVNRKNKKKTMLSIIDKRVGNKRISIHPNSSLNGSGVEILELPDHLNEKPSLSDKQIIELSRIGIQIEAIFKRKPQDIEWAIDKDDKINIVQTRPITSKLPSENQDLPIYSRGYADDYWNDDTTPLFFDLLGSQITKVVNIELNSIMGYERIDNKLIKLYKSHVYFNLDVLKRKVEYEIPSFIRNDDVLNYFPEGQGPYGKDTIKNLPFRLFKRLISELRIRFHDPDGAMSKTAQKYEEWTKEVFGPYCKEFDDKITNIRDSDDLLALFKLAEKLDKVMISHFRLIRYGIPVHNIGMNLMTQYLLTRFFGRKEAQNIFPILISGLNHKLTETNNRIHQMASKIKNSAYLKSIFKQDNSNQIFEQIQMDDNPNCIQFIAGLKDFLIEFGDRGFTREIYYPRWREAPHLIIDILRSLSIEEDKINEITSKSEIGRLKIERNVEKRIKSKMFGPILWKLFSAILRNSRKYIIFRENQRFNLDKWITRNRQLFLEIGKILVNRGLINEQNEIFFFYKNEIKKVIFDEYGAVELNKLLKLVRERMSDFRKYENILPPKFLVGSNEFNDIIEFDENSEHLQGIPASHGIITAPVRILNDINLIPTVQSGEILVVPRTDPGWTPVFSKIGGLITETGGILSHGAVVSREYGIPAVTNVINACKILKTGQIITINGFNGTCMMKD